MIDHAGNPFVVGTSVGGTGYFVGRVDIIQAVVGTLARPLEPGLVLVGQRRIGKSSILRELEEKLPGLGRWQPVFFDLQRHTQASVDEIVADLAATIADTLGLDEPDLGAHPRETFRKTWLPDVLRHTPAISRLVLLLDEFDVLADARAKTSNKDLFEFLRSISEDNVLRKKIAMIYVMGRAMEDLTVSAGSLVKGMRQQAVSTLSRHEFDLLLKRGSDAGLAWAPGVTDAIWRLTSGHPMLTQLIASNAWERAVRTGKTKVERGDVRDLAQMAMREGHNILSYLWEGLTTAGRIVASAFAEQGVGSLTMDGLETLLRQSGVRIMMGQLEEAPARLRDWDILDEEPGPPRRFRFKVELFRQWVQQHRPFAKVREFIDQLVPEADDDYRKALATWNSPQRSEQDITGTIRRLELVLDTLNPNHVGATELLADVYVHKGELDRAIGVVERLFPSQPAALGPRYVRHLLAKARTLVGEENEALLQRCYERIREIAPATLEATEGLRQLWREQGRRAQQAGKLGEARELFVKAGEDALVHEVELELERRRGAHTLRRIHGLAGGEKFDEALALLAEDRGALELVADLDLGALQQNLERARQIHIAYAEGCAAATEGNKSRALSQFGVVLAAQPDHKDVQRQVGALFAPPPRSRVAAALPLLAGTLAGSLLTAGAFWRFGGSDRVTDVDPAAALSAAAPAPVETPTPPATAVSPPPPNPTTSGTDPPPPPASVAGDVTTTASGDDASSDGGATPDQAESRAASAPPPETKTTRPDAKKKDPKIETRPPPTSPPVATLDPPTTPPKRSMSEVARGFKAVFETYCKVANDAMQSKLTVRFTVDTTSGAVTAVALEETDGKLEDPGCVTARAFTIRDKISFKDAGPLEPDFIYTYNLRNQ